MSSLIIQDRVGVRMKLEWIRCFVTLASVKSMNKAAEVLYISQPAISKMMNALEKETGERLLKRHSGGVDLTASGEIFLNFARNVLNAYEDYLSEQAAYNNSMYDFEGTIELAIAPLLLQTYYESIYTNMKQKFPRLTLCFKEANVEVASKLMQVDNRLLGFVINWQDIQERINEELIAEELYQTPIIICTDKRSKYATLRNVNSDTIPSKDIISINYDIFSSQNKIFNFSTTSLDMIRQRLSNSPNLCFMLPQCILDKKLFSPNIIQIHQESKTVATIDFVYHSSVVGQRIYAAEFLQAFKEELHKSLLL